MYRYKYSPTLRHVHTESVCRWGNNFLVLFGHNDLKYLNLKNKGALLLKNIGCKCTYWTQDPIYRTLNVQLCSIHVSVFKSYVINNCIEPFKIGIWDSQDRAIFLWGEEMRTSINIGLVRVGLMISVDREHGTGIDHILSSLTTLPWLKLIISLC